MIAALNKYQKIAKEASKSLATSEVNEEPQAEPQDEDEEDEDDGEPVNEEELFADNEEAQAEAGSSQQPDEEEDAVETPQAEIDVQFMANIKICWPLERYYKSVKRSIQVILASDRIQNKELPPWYSDGCFMTYRKLTQIIPEILFVYQNLGLNENNIGQSVTDL